MIALKGRDCNHWRRTADTAKVVPLALFEVVWLSL